MSPTKKYQLMLAGVLIMFVYVAATEVTDRWMETYNQYKEMIAKAEKVLDPATMAERKLELIAQRNALASQLIVDKGVYEQSQTGVFEFLTQKARSTNVRIESLVPLGAEREGQLENIGFRISASAGFHDIGSYLNALETGNMSVNIKKLELASRTKQASSLHAEIEGVASIFSGKDRQ